MDYINSKVQVKAPAKINLHLEVLGLRKDGLHELAMVMQSISLYDVLDIRLNNSDKITLTTNDQTLSCGPDNLILKSAELLKKRFSKKCLGADIHLEKNIPIGAGLAGGSSDAAATLIGLNSLWNLDLSNYELEQLSSILGSDVPFCISGGTQLCFGRGEILEPLKNPIHPFSLLLIKDPAASVSTPWAYSKCREKKGKDYLKTEDQFEKQRRILRNSSWLTNSSPYLPPPLKNDLQNVVTPYFPEVDKALTILSSIQGTLSRSMSGSGASCFALFNDKDDVLRIIEQYNSQIESNGFQFWCCSFLNQGPQIVYD